MHTYVYGENESELTTFHHNGDYSGDVIISVPSGAKSDGHDRVDFYRVPVTNPKLEDSERTEIRVPFDALKEVVANYVREHLIRRLENGDVTSDALVQLLGGLK